MDLVLSVIKWKPSLIAIKHFVRPRILVKLATYKLSWSALTGQTKCKQTQLAGCKFDYNTRTDKRLGEAVRGRVVIWWG